jgi:pantoate--beta-alanine ligase
MTLRIIDNVHDMTELADSWSFSPDVALVPTMGFLHEGHLSLVREASAHAQKVVVSIFVNPLQFGPAEDFDKYPRNLQCDAELLAGAGADLVFAPEASDMTPEDMVFQVDPGPMGAILCGQYRPGHFAGVSTIVTKLFNVVRPGLAVFGWKDAQQFLILQKMVKELNMPLKLIGLDTAREADGLAMSSRNSYLNEQQRKAVPAIYAALQSAANAYRNGEESTANLLQRLVKHLKAEPLLSVQYAEAVSLDKLEPVDTVERGNTLIAVAVFAGETRLIDNIRL